MSSDHRCVDCRALPEAQPVDTTGWTFDEIVAHAVAAPPQTEKRPRRPRAIDHRSDPPRCYSHLAAARRAGLPVYRSDASAGGVR